MEPVRGLRTLEVFHLISASGFSVCLNESENKKNASYPDWLLPGRQFAFTENPTSHRAILECASDIVLRLDDGKHIFYCDVNHVFLNTDGSINYDMMPDWLHPSPAGAKAWAQAMEPLLLKLMLSDPDN